MTPKVDKREEGLRELAGMIAAAYRRRMTGETIEPRAYSKSDEEYPISEGEIVACIEPADSRSGYVYTETVKVENFIRNKVYHARNSRNRRKAE